MSYSLNDPALDRALDAYYTRGPRDEEPVYGSPVTCDECEETHPSDDYAAEDGWTIVHTDDHDTVLCPGHTAAVAVQDAADLASGSYFTPGVTQATGALEPCETCPPDSSLCSDCFIGNEPTCPACYLARSEHTPQMLRACAVVLARLAAFERSQNTGAA